MYWLPLSTNFTVGGSANRSVISCQYFHYIFLFRRAISTCILHSFNTEYGCYDKVTYDRFVSVHSKGIKLLQYRGIYMWCTCAISIHVVMIRARSLGRTSGSMSTVLITRSETALNWFTVARTVAASWLRFLSRRDHMAPRHWCGTNFLNNSCIQIHFS